MIKKYDIESNNELEQLFDSLIQKYYTARKLCHTMFLREPKLWRDIFTQLKNNRDSNAFTTQYTVCQNLINQLYYLFQIYGIIEFEDEIPEEDKQHKVYKENEVLYFALMLKLKDLFSNNYEQIFQFCYEQEYTQEFMQSLYQKFVGKLHNKYPQDYNQLLDIVQEQKQTLDALYFCVNYNGDTDFIDFI